MSYNNSLKAKSIACNSTCALALFHFVFCGLPMASLLLSSIIGFSYSVPSYMNMHIKTGILVITGIMMLLSFYITPKAFKNKMLLAALLLYIISSSMHFYMLLNMGVSHHH